MGKMIGIFFSGINAMAVLYSIRIKWTLQLVTHKMKVNMI